MARIIAGRLKTEEHAERVMSDLRGRGIADRDMQTFYVGPAGQHAAHPIGGDAASDAGAKQVGFTAVAGAIMGAVVGVVIGVVVAYFFAFALPAAGAVVLVAGGIGGYVGSLYGGLSGTKNPRKERDTEEHPVARRAGAMVAVHVTRPEHEQLAIATLEAHGAVDVERAEGEWSDGEWRDFDPVKHGRPVRQAKTVTG
jgi:hypothetical protein